MTESLYASSLGTLKSHLSPPFVVAELRSFIESVHISRSSGFSGMGRAPIDPGVTRATSSTALLFGTTLSPAAHRA